jgi:hypothetical protein
LSDTTYCPALPRGPLKAVAPPSKAERFVDGEHTVADDLTRQIILQLLEEIGVLDDATPYLHLEAAASRLGKRAVEAVEKRIDFMASFLRTVLKVEWFGILMTRKRWVGKPCGYNAARTITTALIDKGIILKVVKPVQGARSTIYCCSVSFRQRLQGWRGLLSFKRARPHPIEVREPRNDYRGETKKKRLPLERFAPGAVRRHRQTVIDLNEHLSRYTILNPSGRPLDTTLRRIFAGDLRSGGRLYGDYQSMSEADRLRCTIDGEPVCEIDLKASHLAILAALMQFEQRLPKDPYGAISWVKTPLHRKAAKTIVQCVVYAENGRPTRLPRTDDGVPFRIKYDLGKMTMRDLLPGIFEIMPFLDGTPRLTLYLQFVEAEILIDALWRLRKKDIPALPIHDSLLVKQSDAVEVLEVLQETLRAALGPHAPWLDVTLPDQHPNIVKPLSCAMHAHYELKEPFQGPKALPLRYGRELFRSDRRCWGDSEGDF